MWRIKLLLTAVSVPVISMTMLSPVDAIRPNQEKSSAVPGQRNGATIKVVMTKGNMNGCDGKVSVSYPRLIGSDAITCAKLNSIIKNTMFENDYWDLVELTFDPTFASPNYFSTGFTFYRRGGAHRNGFYVPINYKLTSSVAKMNLDDLFGGKVDYRKLCEICGKHIRAKGPGDDADALNPNADQFQNFNFNEHRVRFTFCQLSCEAFGVQSFDIPLEELKDLLSPSSPLLKFAKKI